MKFKLTEFEEAVAYMQRMARNHGLDVEQIDMDIVINEENIGSSKIGSAMVVTIEGVAPSAQYETYKVDKPVKLTLEIFPVEENRSPRLLVEQTTELKNRKTS